MGDTPDSGWKYPSSERLSMTDTTNLSGRVCVVVNDLGTDLDGSGEDPEPAETTAASIREAGGEATAHFVDVSDLNVAAGLVETALEEHGRLDCVAKSVVILRDGYATNLSAEDWDEVVRVHLRSHFALLRAAARRWREAAGEEGLKPRRSFVAVTSRWVIGTSASSTTRRQRPAFSGSPGRPPRSSSTWASESTP